MPRQTLLRLKSSPPAARQGASPGQPGSQAQDFLLAAVAIVLAFLIASFAARNSDVWLHLATGQRLLTGEYRPGTDPFSYTGSERTWVNHSVLYDVGTTCFFGPINQG